MLPERRRDENFIPQIGYALRMGEDDVMRSKEETETMRSGKVEEESMCSSEFQ